MLALSQLSVSLFNPSPWESGHLYSGWVSSLLTTIFGNALKIYTEVCLLGGFKSHRVAKEHCRNIDDINCNHHCPYASIFLYLHSLTIVLLNLNLTNSRVHRYISMLCDHHVYKSWLYIISTVFALMVR